LDENESLYRRQLAEYVDGTKLKKFPSERFKSLINELSIEQLRVFADHIDEVGLKKLARSAKFENLMKDVLSDKNSAMQIVADDQSSHICPHIWEGADIVMEENIFISGYYYQNGEYFLDVSCDEDNSYNIALGSTKPSDVSIRITRATAWAMAGEQLGLLVKLYASLPVAADLTYATATSMGMMPFLPENISPSDVPYLGEFLAEIDPMNLTAHITKETVFVSIFIEHGGNGEEGYRTDYDAVRFHEYRG
jgi:hypothetical protein